MAANEGDCMLKPPEDGNGFRFVGLFPPTIYHTDSGCGRKHHTGYAYRSKGSKASILLRGLGLPLFQKTSRTSGPGCERPKIALWKSRPVALLHAVIHILPVSAAIAITVVNCVGIYVGLEAAWLPTLQFLAKAVEMLMQASIAAVCFTYLRHELVHHALPFGALFSAFQTNHLSYLWSLEFWGTVTSKGFASPRKFVFLLFVPLSILLSATVGPSFAVALIPRDSAFPAGTAAIWLDGTRKEIFSASLGTDNVPDNCTLSPAYPLVGDACPFSEWPAIAVMLSDYPGYAGQRWNSLQSQTATRQLFLDVTTEQSVKSVYATSQQAAVTEALQAVADLWTAAVSGYPSGGNPSRFGSYYNFYHKLDALQPYVMARCLSNSMEAYTSRRFAFPARQSAWTDEHGHWTVTNFTVEPNYELGAADNPSYHLSWVDLPRVVFANISIGAIITPPRTSNQTETELLACSIYAGWGAASVNLTASSTDIIGSEFPPFSSENAFLWSMDWVAITKEWAQSLTPPISGHNTTVDGAIYDTMVDELDPSNQDATHAAYPHEAVVASLIANGMARTGFDTPILGIHNDTTFSSETTEQWLTGINSNIFAVDPSTVSDRYHFIITTTITGRAYTTDGVPIKLAFAVLLSYSLYAFIHLCYAGISGISSSSWNSIAELVALALNSAQTDRLRNTAAGITGLEVFREPVRVCAVNGDHLELVFQDKARPRVAYSQVKANRLY